MRKLASANVLFFMDLLNSAGWDYPDFNYRRGKFSLKRYYLFPHYVTSEVKIHYSNTYLYVVIKLLDWLKGLTSKKATWNKTIFLLGASSSWEMHIRIKNIKIVKLDI